MGKTIISEDKDLTKRLRALKLIYVVSSFFAWVVLLCFMVGAVSLAVYLFKLAFLM